MRKVFNKELLEIAKKDPRVFMILADIGYGEIEEFANTFPDRFINCGVAEQNMTGVACGGFIPEFRWLECSRSCMWMNCYPSEHRMNAPRKLVLLKSLRM